jgi:hypothetical protein
MMRPGVEIALLMALAVTVWLWVLMPSLHLVFADP